MTTFVKIRKSEIMLINENSYFYAEKAKILNMQKKVFLLIEGSAGGNLNITDKIAPT